MAAPVDPYDFQNLVSIVDAAQVNLRFRRLFDALDKTKVGLDGNSFKDGAFTAAKFVAAEAWQTLALSGGTWNPTTLAYYKDQQGIVRVRSDGILFTGTLSIGATLGTFPAGYRPVAKAYITLCRQGLGGGYLTPGNASVDTDGTLRAEGESSGYGAEAGSRWFFHGSWRGEG